MSRRRIGAVLGLLVLVLTAPRGGLAAGGVPDPDAIRFRASFGFPSDPAFVVVAAADRIQFSNDDWGVPLSPAESAEMHRRVAVQHAADEVVEYAAGRLGFAGLYSDHARGGRPVFLFARGRAGSERAEIRRRMGDVLVDVVDVDRSFEDLERLRSQIEDRKQELERAGLVVISTAISPSTNSVVVGIENLTSEKARTIEDEFGPGVSVRADQRTMGDACTFDACWPAKGGFQVHPDGLANNKCTSGFVAKLSDGRLGLLTAGHCFGANGGSGKVWEHGSPTEFRIGTSSAHSWVAGANADAGFIMFSPSSQIPATKNLYMTEPEVTRALTTVVEIAAQNQGDVICRTGINGGKDCGLIFLENQRRPSCARVNNVTVCKDINHQWEVDFDSLGGDSGGPMHVGITSGFGIHIHSEDETNPNLAPHHGWYSPLGWIRSEWIQRYSLFWSFCINSSCSAVWP